MNEEIKELEEKQISEDFIQSVHITNDVMFGAIMSNPDICKAFLEQILDIKIDHVEYLEKQKTVKNNIHAKGIRLDIYMEDGETVYNCEMQTSNSREIPKRTRYYQGQIDLNMIQAGDSYRKLKKSFIIFICTFDPFGKGRYVYTFKPTCQEDKDIVLDDETARVIINTKGFHGEVSQDFKDLMDYFNDPDAAKTCKNPLVKKLEESVRKMKQNEEWRNDFMKWNNYGQEKYDEGQLHIVIELFLKGKISLSDAADSVKMSEDELKKVIDSMYKNSVVSL